MSQAGGTDVVGCNVQVAIHTKHHLIVIHEVRKVGSDRAQLSPMANAARDAMGRKKIKALAGRGYFGAPEIKVCNDAGVVPLLPKTQTSGAKADGRFDDGSMKRYLNRGSPDWVAISMPSRYGGGQSSTSSAHSSTGWDRRTSRRTDSAMSALK